MYQIRLSQGLYVLVSLDDAEAVAKYKWTASKESRGTKWYAVRWERNGATKRKVRMHRFIMENRGIDLEHPHKVVDHINHNSLDNRWENLELVTQAENMKRSPGWKKKK